MKTLTLVFQSLIKIFSIVKVVGSVTLAYGLVWRFSLIAGYVFSIQAVGVAFNSASGLATTPVAYIPYLGSNIVLTGGLLGIAVVFLFAIGATSDVLYTNKRIQLEVLIELWMTRKLSRSRDCTFKEITTKRKSYAAQILMKCFDLTYAGVLILISIFIMTLTSPILTLLLIIVTLFFGVFLIWQKRIHIKKLRSLADKSSPRRLRSQKLMRSSHTRATTTLIAGLFLSLLVVGVNAQLFLSELGLIELAIIAFCTRFFISFFSLFYLSFVSLSDSLPLLKEFLIMK